MKIEGVNGNAVGALFFAALFGGLASWLFAATKGEVDSVGLVVSLAAAFLGLAIWLFGCFIAFLIEKEAPVVSDKTKEHP